MVCLLHKNVRTNRIDKGEIMTIILGIVGSIVGGFLAGLIGISQDDNPWDIGSIVISVLGALLVLFVYGKLVTKQ